MEWCMGDEYSSGYAGWAAEGEQHPKKQYSNRRQYGRAFSVVMFWLFLCLIALISGPEVIVWLLMSIGG